jgi:hypothetical protein
VHCDTRSREQHFGLQCRLIVLQVLTKLQDRFPFPSSGLSFEQSADIRSGAYWRNTEKRWERATRRQEISLQVVYKECCQSGCVCLSAWLGFINKRHSDFRRHIVGAVFWAELSSNFFHNTSTFFAVRHLVKNHCWSVLSPVSLNLQQNTHKSLWGSSVIAMRL